MRVVIKVAIPSHPRPEGHPRDPDSGTPPCDSMNKSLRDRSSHPNEWPSSSPLSPTADRPREEPAQRTRCEDQPLGQRPSSVAAVRPNPRGRTAPQPNRDRDPRKPGVHCAPFRLTRPLRFLTPCDTVPRPRFPHQRDHTALASARLRRATPRQAGGGSGQACPACSSMCCRCIVDLHMQTAWGTVGHNETEP